jgi:hypothetical protein
VYVPAISPDIIVLVPVPLVVTAPGFLVKVHAPVVGNPLSTTLPVASVHVGCVMAPATGAVGVGGCAAIITFAEGAEIQPASLVTV